ncbi:hypothetical protein ACFP8W_09885, partial [Nocardioides hankookensis]
MFTPDNVISQLPDGVHGPFLRLAPGGTGDAVSLVTTGQADDEETGHGDGDRGTERAPHAEAGAR